MTEPISAPARKELKELGIELFEALGQGASSVVFRVRASNGDAAAKVYRDAESEATLRKFRKEAASIARLVSPYLPRIIRYGVAGRQPFLVMEFLSGGSLAAVLRAEPAPWKEARVVELATRLAEALETVHRVGVVHRDVKPDNVLFDGHGTPKLVDFDLATNTAGRSGEMAGTPGYMAPELTGLVSARVDGRADLYSLGVLLYQVASGRLPFESDSVAELLRMHAFDVPPSLDARTVGISPALCRVIHRLLEKNPADRYQSGHGLTFDLERLDALNGQLAAGRDLVLGQGDSVGQLIDRLPLVGRTAELAILAHAVKEAAIGRPHVVLVEGDAGSGKSKLLATALSDAERNRRRGLRLWAKCVDGAATPLAPVREALDGLAGVISRGLLPNEVDAPAIARLLQPHAPVVNALSPRLTKALGFPALAAAPGEQFLDAVAQALLSLSAVPGGCVWLVDDIQWADATTIQVIRSLAERLVGRSFLLLSASRSTSESAAGVQRYVDCFQQVPVERIPLSPLTDLDVLQLIRNLLGGFAVEPALAEKVTLRANGNAFAVGELIRALLEGGLLLFDGEQWRLDEKGFASIQLPSDVIQLVVRRLEGISPSAQQVLLAAAVGGNAFSVEAVGQVVRESPALVGASAGEALRAGLVEPSDEGAFRFVHDRVREALLRRADAGAIADMHQEWAEHYARATSRTREEVFSEARHRVQGRVERDPSRAFEQCMEAADLAFATFAYEAADEFLQWAGQVAERHGLPVSSEYAFARGEVAVRTAKPSAEALRWFSEAHDAATSPGKRAFALARRGYVHTVLQEFDVASKDVEAALRLIGLPPIGRTNGAVVAALLSPGLWFGRAGSLSPEEQETRVLAMELAYVAGYVGFFTMDTPLLLNSAIAERRITRRLPECAAKLRAVTDTAFIVANAGQAVGVKWSEEALRRAEVLGDPTVIARAAVYAAYAKVWLGVHDEDARNDLLGKYDPWLSLEEWMNVRLVLGWERLVQGHATEARQMLSQLNTRWTQRYSGSGTLNNLPWSLLFVAQHMCGDEKAASLNARTARQIAARFRPGERFQTFRFLGCEAMVDCLDGNSDNLDSLEQRYAALEAKPQYVDFSNTQFYVATARLWALAAWRNERADAGKQAKQALSRLKTAAKGNKCLLAHHRIAAAYLAAARGQQNRAASAISEAEAWARSHDLPIIEFEAKLFFARVLLRDNQRTQAMAQARYAHEIASGHGWRRLALQIESEFSYVPARVLAPVGGEPASSTSMSMYASGGVQRRLDALLEVSLAIASVFDAERQVQIALGEMIRIFSAERGFIFLCGDDDVLKRKIGRTADNRPLASEDYSTTIIHKVASTRQPRVATASDAGEELASRSAVALGLRTLVAAPLQLKDRLLGVVYLDSTVARGTFSGEDLELLVALANHISVSLESSRVARIEVQNAALAKDLALTGAVQALLLPPEDRWEAPGLRISASFVPATQCGGDWWWIDDEDSNRIRVIVGDVTGHGAGSAMVTAAVAGAYRAIRRSTRSNDVGDMLTILNRVVASVCRGEYLMTMSIIDLGRGDDTFDVHFAAAPAILLARTDGRCDVLALTGTTPLGTGDPHFGKLSGTWGEGDVFLVATDGVLERETKSGRPFGLRHVKKVLSSAAALPPEEIASELTAAIARQAAGEANDDTTFAIIKKLSGARR